MKPRKHVPVQSQKLENLSNSTKSCEGGEKLRACFFYCTYFDMHKL